MITNVMFHHDKDKRISSVTWIQNEKARRFICEYSMEKFEGCSVDNIDRAIMSELLNGFYELSIHYLYHD